MKVFRLVIIAGHGLIGPGPADPGGTGKGGTEAAWTARAAEAIASACRAAGIEAAVDEVGASLDRSSDADGVAPDLILYVHGDIGAGGIFYYPNSLRGIALANQIGAELRTILPSLTVREASGGFPRAYALLGRTKAPAVLLELCDQRSPESVGRLLERLDDVAGAVARGLTA